MGNRDKRGREKKKPKRKESRETSRLARPTAEWKPVPAEPRQTGSDSPTGGES
jgi:hypothetical protein